MKVIDPKIQIQNGIIFFADPTHYRSNYEFCFIAQTKYRGKKTTPFFLNQWPISSKKLAPWNLVQQLEQNKHIPPCTITSFWSHLLLFELLTPSTQYLISTTPTLLSLRQADRPKSSTFMCSHFNCLPILCFRQPFLYLLDDPCYNQDNDHVGPGGQGAQNILKYKSTDEVRNHKSWHHILVMSPLIYILFTSLSLTN